MHGCWLPSPALLAVAGWLLATVAAAAEPDAAQKLLLTGKYEEAIEAFQELADDHPKASAIGVAQARAAMGQDDRALEALDAALKKSPDAADLLAEKASLHFQHGQIDQADAAVAAALKKAPNHLLARWIQAERWRTSGKLDEADKAYKSFVDYYNEQDVTRPEELCLIGRAAAQYARWHGLSEQFTFLVNELFPEVLQLDPAYWPATYEAGVLFIEKYNDAEANKHLESALELNPAAADAHAAMARLGVQNYQLEGARRHIDRALEINPRHLGALQSRADAHMANFELADAIETLEAARAINPIDEETLGRLAAVWSVVDGVDLLAKDSRGAKLAAEVEARNPHCGTFYLQAGAALDLTRHYPAAAKYYELAVARMPQLIEPRGMLGMMYMRLGDEAQARKLLSESFEVDPFNVRVSNSLKVLEVLDDYAVLETEHFIIKFDRVKDGLLAKYVARYLEDEVYPQLTKQFGFKPEGKSLFEIFNRARNTRGHGWFSARMVGLPYVGTVGACAGKMVALASPNDMPSPYNWARVVKHEFVHVLNLQQSKFNIPHWYTEALAVESEGYPRQPSWNEMLVARVPAGKMFNLENINLGFVRPKSGEDWQMAYCQAQLYAQYMLKTYGDEALAKMLNCYADNLNTRDALKRSFNVDQADFERGYRKYVEELVEQLSIEREKPSESMKFADLVRAQKEKPDDPALAARLASAYFERKNYPDARKLAEQAMKADPHNGRAAVVLARVRMVIGEDEAAKELLLKAVDEKQPEPVSLRLLADMHYKNSDYEPARQLYELGAKTWADDVQWTKALARLYLKTGEKKRLFTTLERLASFDADDLLLRKKLAYLALEEENYAAAARWGREALYANVQDGDSHRLLADALVGQRKFKDAIEEFQAAISLDEKQPAWRFSLADAYLQGGDTAGAIETLERLVAIAPEYPGAAQLLEALREEQKAKNK
ncbi:MAG: tetratricopeptide repeat protein [Planctomycetes bacterium]|nr:tetratricopeptide repeat protein [Planctomycetota bacterium]